MLVEVGDLGVLVHAEYLWDVHVGEVFYEFEDFFVFLVLFGEAVGFVAEEFELERYHGQFFG